MKTFEQINGELNAFYDFCRENSLTDEEIERLCAPLDETINRSKLARKLKICAAVALAVSLAYYVLTTDLAYWHLLTWSRIVLLKLLPWWDWRVLSDGKCSVDPAFAGYNVATKTPYNCDLCETLEEVASYGGSDPYHVEQRFIRVHKPVVVDANLTAPTKLTLTDLLIRDVTIADSDPCNPSTNLHANPHYLDLGSLLAKAKAADRYFLHFQNCDLDAVKKFRLLTPRPAFVPPPIKFSWVFLSKDYNVTRFKAVDHSGFVNIFGQVHGANHLRLLPRDCQDMCRDLQVELRAGQSLLFTRRWQLEYRPAEKGENVAVLLQSHEFD